MVIDMTNIIKEIKKWLGLILMYLAMILIYIPLINVVVAPFIPIMFVKGLVWYLCAVTCWC